MNNLSADLPTLNSIGGRFYPQGWGLQTPIECIRYEIDVHVPKGLGFVVPRHFMFETAFARRRGQAYLDEAMTREVPEGMEGRVGEPLTLYIKPPMGIPSRELAQCTVEIYVKYFRLPLAQGENEETFRIQIPYHMTGAVGPVGAPVLIHCQAQVFRADDTGLAFQMPYWPAPRRSRLVLAWD